MEMAEQIIITRLDKNLVWTIMPEQKMYMETKLGEEAEEEEDCKACELKPAGTEVVNGVTATKYKFTPCPKHKSEGESMMWLSKEWITVKTEGVIIDEGKKVQIKSELKNLKIGKQDSSLFEIPKGYQKAGGGDDYSSIEKGYLKSQEEESEKTTKEYADLLKEGRSFKLTDWEKAKTVSELNFKSGYWSIKKEIVNETFEPKTCQGERSSDSDILDSDIQNMVVGSTEDTVIKRIGNRIIWKTNLLGGFTEENGEIICSDDTFRAISVTKIIINGSPISATYKRFLGKLTGEYSRDYTSQPRTGRDYTSQPRKDKPVDTLKKGLKGLFGK
jgi:hypothetical protein